MAITLKVRFTKRLFGSAEGNFSVYSATPTGADKKKVPVNKYGSISISGDFYIEDQELGRTFTVEIDEDLESKFPNSYKMGHIVFDFPSTPKEQWELLREGDFVSAVLYDNLLEEFGKNDLILDRILSNPTSLEVVDGIGGARSLSLQGKIQSEKGRSVLYMKYGKIEGVGSRTITSIYNWKADINEAIKLIEKNPFNLLTIKGIGFLLADRFRAFYEIPQDDPRRILHACKYYLEEMFQSTGDTYATSKELINRVSERLSLNPLTIFETIKENIKNEEFVEVYGLKLLPANNFTTANLFEAEQYIFKKIKALAERDERILPKKDWEENKRLQVSSTGVELSPEQDKFLSVINDSSVTMLVGPGGAGKSWVTKLAVSLYEKANLKVELVSPTAQAASVLSDYVGREAGTIHRKFFKLLMANELSLADVIIVDEASMVDSELMAVVLKVMKRTARLVIIGDDFQLPSVSPGNILFDFINHLDVPTVKLSRIYRQSEGSRIVDYTEQLRSGDFWLNPESQQIDHEDIKFVNLDNDVEIGEMAIEIYKKALKKNKYTDIMLLTPINKTQSGRTSFNARIQGIVNDKPTDYDMKFGENNPDTSALRTYRKNDYIKIKQNMYNEPAISGSSIDLLNGDLGYVEKVTRQDIWVKIEGEIFKFGKADVMECIDHAWASTIHGAQGGQANEVIIVVPPRSRFMMSANMLYTAISRAKVKVTILGSFNTMNSCARKYSNFNRKTLIQLQVELGKKTLKTSE